MFDDMDTPPKSKPIGRVFATCSGILLFVLGANSLRNGIIGVMTEKTYSLGKGTHYLVLKHDNPGEFWIWIVTRFTLATCCFVIAVRLAITCFKQKR